MLPGCPRPRPPSPRRPGRRRSSPCRTWQARCVSVRVRLHRLPTYAISANIRWAAEPGRRRSEVNQLYSRQIHPSLARDGKLAANRAKKVHGSCCGYCSWVCAVASIKASGNGCEQKYSKRYVWDCCSKSGRGFQSNDVFPLLKKLCRNAQGVRSPFFLLKQLGGTTAGRKRPGHVARQRCLWRGAPSSRRKPR